MPASCGGGGPRQDEAEAEFEGDYPVEIVTSQFPNRQRLAQTSFLRLGIANSGDETIPDLAVTITIAGEQGEQSIRPFYVRDPQPGLAAPDRPVWILENDYPRLAGEVAPAGAETANAKTFAFGELDPGKRIDAVWKLTPVRPGRYTLLYTVDAGLQGKAHAVTSAEEPVTGSFVVEITSTPPQTRVNDAGEVVVVPRSESRLPGGGQAGPENP